MARHTFGACSVLCCGMSIGFEDVTVGYTRTGRAPLDEMITFADGYRHRPPSAA